MVRDGGAAGWGIFFRERIRTGIIGVSLSFFNIFLLKLEAIFTGTYNILKTNNIFSCNAKTTFF
jgi:hypothetical protein